MNRSLFIIVLALAGHILPAQPKATIYGKVSSAGEPLMLANIVCVSTGYGAASDEHGEYRIILPAGTYKVRCSMVGYRTQIKEVSLNAGQRLQLDFELEETPLQLGEIVTTAGRRPQSLEEVPVSLSIMEGRDIDFRALTSLDEALRYIPGVNMTDDQVNIRGSSGYSRSLGSRVLLLIDGFPLLSADGGEIKHDVVPMFDVERIEVLKGAGSALYGSSALGGVVNVITSKPQNDELRFRLFSGFYDRTSYADWNWWGESPRWFNAAYGRIQKVYTASSFRISAGVYGNQGYRKMDDFVRWNVTGSGWLKLANNHQLHVSANIASNNRGNWIFWKSLKQPLVPPDNTDLSERVVSNKQYVYAKHSWLVNSLFSMENRLYVYHTENDTKSDTSDFSLRPADRVQSSAYVVGYQWQGIYSGVQGHLLTGGMDASWYYVDARTFGRRSAVSWALYLQDEFSLFRDVRVTAGVRGDYTKVDIAKVDGRFNPRVGMTYDPAPGSTIRASVGLGFRSPSIAERFAVAGAAGLQTKPNPDILSERSTSYEIGFRQVIFPFAVIDLALFRNDYNDLVEPIIDSSDARIVFQNITQARILGGEISISSTMFDDLLQFQLGYTYLDPVDLTLNQTLKYRPRHLLIMNMNLHYGAFLAGVDVRYLSRVETIDDEISFIVRDADKRVPIWRTDVRLQWKSRLLGHELLLTGMVNNLFNYYYVEVVGNMAPIRYFTLVLETSL